MRRLARPLEHCARDDSGATSIEYALIAACIALLLVSSVYEIGAAFAQIFAALSAAFG
jgi:Flp pilus assembly pilin Flp